MIQWVLTIDMLISVFLIRYFSQALLSLEFALAAIGITRIRNSELFNICITPNFYSKNQKFRTFYCMHKSELCPELEKTTHFVVYVCLCCACSNDTIRYIYRLCLFMTQVYAFFITFGLYYCVYCVCARTYTFLNLHYFVRFKNTLAAVSGSSSYSVCFSS